MKEVTYFRFGQEPKTHELTDKEFMSALREWAGNKPYWCDRLERMFPPNPGDAGTPERYKKFVKVFVHGLSGTEVGLLKAHVDEKTHFLEKEDLDDIEPSLMTIHEDGDDIRYLPVKQEV